MLRRFMLVFAILLASTLAFAVASQPECRRQRLLVVNDAFEAVDLSLVNLHGTDERTEVWRASLPENSARRAAYHLVGEGSLLAVMTRSDGRREEMLLGYVTSPQVEHDILLIEHDGAAHASFFKGSLLFDIDSDGTWATFGLYARLAHEMSGCLAQEATKAIW